MADEWRVSVSLPKRSRAEEDSPWTTAMRALRGRIGSDIGVSQAPRRVFLYAASAHSATQVEQVVRDVLTSTLSAPKCDASNGTRLSSCGPRTKTS
jgi:hypothetical protein